MAALVHGVASLVAVAVSFILFPLGLLGGLVPADFGGIAVNRGTKGATNPNRPSQASCATFCTGCLAGRVQIILTGAARPYSALVAGEPAVQASARLAAVHSVSRVTALHALEVLTKSGHARHVESKPHQVIWQPGAAATTTAA